MTMFFSQLLPDRLDLTKKAPHPRRLFCFWQWLRLRSKKVASTSLSHRLLWWLSGAEATDTYFRIIIFRVCLTPLISTV